MRISTLQMFHTNIDAMMLAQKKVDNIQQQVSTNKKLLSDSDNPVIADQINALNNSQAQLKTYAGNIVAAKNQAALEESTLTSFNKILTQVSTLGLSVLNGAFNADNREAIATQLDARVSDLMNLANTQDASGNYLFSGAQVKTKPFVTTAGVVNYQGDANQRMLDIASNNSVAVSDAGHEIFNSKNSYVATPGAGNTGSAIISNVELGSTYTPNNYTITFDSATTYGITDGQGAVVVAAGTAYTDGNPISFNGMQVTITGTPVINDSFSIGKADNIFNTIKTMINSIRSASGTAALTAKFTSVMNSSLAAIDVGASTVLNKVAEVGSRLNTVTDADNVMQEFSLNNTKALSSLSDVDLVQTVSQLSQQTLLLQALQKMYVQTSNLTLFSQL